MDNKTANKRPALFAVFLGTNRTGKSSTANKYVRNWRKHNPNKKVMAFDPQNNFKDLVDIEIPLECEDWDERICSLRNGLLILDDFRVLHEAGAASSGLKKLMAYRAKWCVDIIMIFHAPAQVILFTTTFITHYYIFRIQSVKKSFSDRIPDYEKCLKASAIVNEYVKQNGLGGWVENEPKFPHVIVTNQTDKIFFQNMEPQALRSVILKLGL